jgi:hypothetical protein
MTDNLQILSLYPDTHPMKLKDASLFTFALGCGARAITVSHLRLSDIVQVTYYPDIGMNFIIIIIYFVIKILKIL